MYNMVNMGVLFVFIYTVWGAGLYPGVHLPTTMLIALPMSIIMGILYVLIPLLVLHSISSFALS